MRFLRIPASRGGSRKVFAWPSWALLALLACAGVTTLARPARAAVPKTDTLIQVLFGDSSDTDGLDANGDGALTVADVLPLARVLFAGTVAEVSPHNVGDQLIYRVTDPMGAVSTETYTVISSDAQGTFVVDYEVVDSQQHVVFHATQSYTDAGNMLFSGNSTDLLRNVRTVCNPPLLRLTTPILAGQKSSTTVLCEIRSITPNVLLGTLKRTDAYTPLGIVDNFSVPAGTYSGVLHITGTTDLSGEHEADEIYIVPGVGTIVQLATVRRQTTRHELVSGTVGGMPVTR